MKSSSGAKPASKLASSADEALPPPPTSNAPSAAAAAAATEIPIDELVDEDVLVVSQRLPVDSDDDDASNEGGSMSNLLDPSSSKSYSLVGNRRRPATPRYFSILHKLDQ